MSSMLSIFFDKARQGLLGPTLSQDEVRGCEVILKAFENTPISWVAYALATAYHETAHSMQPIKEFGGDAYFRRRYDIRGNNPALAKRLGNTVAGDGVKYAGRGYVQLTGRANYARAGKLLLVNLIDNPIHAMETAVAANIMRSGMTDGWFTGKKLGDYLPAKGLAGLQHFRPARRIINGLDKANAIANYALEFQDNLNVAGWPK